MTPASRLDPTLRKISEHQRNGNSENPPLHSDLLARAFAFLTDREAQEVRTVSKKFNNATLKKVEQRALKPLRTVGFFILIRLDPWEYASEIKILTNLLKVQEGLFVVQVKTNLEKLHEGIENVLRCLDENTLAKLKREVIEEEEHVKNSFIAFCNLVHARKEISNDEKFCFYLIRTGNGAKALEIAKKQPDSHIRKVGSESLFHKLTKKFLSSGQLALALYSFTLTGTDKEEMQRFYKKLIKNHITDKALETAVCQLPQGKAKDFGIGFVINICLAAGLTHRAAHLLIYISDENEYDKILVAVMDAYFIRGQLEDGEKIALNIKALSAQTLVFKNLSHYFLLVGQIEKAEHYASKISCPLWQREAFQNIVNLHIYQRNSIKAYELRKKHAKIFVPPEDFAHKSDFHSIEKRNTCPTYLKALREGDFLAASAEIIKLSKSLDYYRIAERDLFEAVILNGNERMLLEIINRHGLDYALQYIVKTIFVKRLQKQFLLFIDQIPDPMKKNYLLLEICNKFSMCEDFKQTEQIIELSENPLKTELSDALFTIKIWRRDLKDLPENTPQEQLYEFIHALKMEGNFSKALNYVDRVLDTEKQLNLRLNFFNAYLHKGQIAHARAITELLPDGPEKTDALEALALPTQTNTWS